MDYNYYSIYYLFRNNIGTTFVNKFILSDVLLMSLRRRRSHSLCRNMLLNQTELDYRTLNCSCVEYYVNFIDLYNRHRTEYHTQRSGKLLQEIQSS
jgi:hypothetical protein